MVVIFELMIFIILGSLPFIAYIKFLNGNKKIFISDVQIKSFIKIIVLSIVILFIYSLLINKDLTQINIRAIFFNICLRFVIYFSKNL